MINAIVQNKQGETAVIDLTVHYHEIYKELQSLGYYGSPERLLLRDEKDEECYSCTATRARLWTIGVTKQGGSWYVTVDEKAITGEGYSDEVQKSLKLENHFSKEFLENNYSVHFFMYASSMHGAAYLRPTVSVENNLVLDVRDRLSDPNGGVDGIVEKNVVNSSLTVSESGNVYNFDVPSVGSVILSEPLNKDGFSIKASMPLLSGNQWVYYTFSNDPDFLSGDELTVVIIQFASGQNTVFYNGVERTERFSGFYGGSVTRTLSFVNDGDVYKLRLYTPGSDLTVSDPDFASLMNKPIYLKVTGDAYIDINSCCRFGMYIGRNEGTLTLDNVNFVPADNELDRNLNFTSWRDAFHVKDNRCRVIWNNCTAVGNYDDVINISSSALYVSAYDEDTRSVSLVWPESSTGLYYEIKPGDTLSVIDTSTGADCGTVEVESVTEQSDGANKIIIKTPLENFTSCGTQLLAYFANRCAPDSEITDCNFNGTFRFRGPLTVSNSTIYNMRTWIDVEGTREGPVPRDIKFIACDIAAGKSSSIIIKSYNSSENGYHVSNISFENCIFEDNTLAIGSNDKGYVSLIDCKRHDGTNIE